MKIRYRDFHGHFISPGKASKQKRIISEVYDEKTGKRIGERVRGYFKEVKKLAREAMPKVSTRKEKEYISRQKPKPLTTTRYADYSDDYDSDFGTDEDFEELEEEWSEEYEADFGELDDLDNLEELLIDDDDWYSEE